MNAMLTREQWLEAIAQVLQAGLAPLQEQVRELKERLAEAAAADPTRPLTAEQLCERWNIPGDTDALKLHNLARKARNWGLKPLKGTCGWDALYALASVVHAESYAAGQVNRRRNAA